MLLLHLGLPWPTGCSTLKTKYPPVSAMGQALSQPGEPCLTDDKSLRTGLLSVLSYCVPRMELAGGVSHTPTPNDLDSAKDTESLSSQVVRLCPSTRSGKASVF